MLKNRLHADREPHEYPRRILLAATGLSPQVVTETIYALAVAGRPAFIPTEVRLITTTEGAERVKLELLHAKNGWFHRLRTDYHLPPITFRIEHLHVIEDAAGRRLSDIRDPAGNTNAADFITSVVRELTQDADCALHVSIAGGRKTMGFYTGYALSLYGREQDRLSHVLVNAPYESHPQFFYPTTQSQVIYTHGPDQRPFDTRDAEVKLAVIPFVRLRDGLGTGLLDGQASFSSVVADAQRTIPPVRLELNLSDCTVEAGGESFRMEPSKFAFYWMLAEYARQGCPGIHWSEKGADEFLEYYRRMVNEYSGPYERAETAFLHGWTGDNVNPTKRHINRKLEQHLGRRHAAPYLIENIEHIPNSNYRRFGLKLSPDTIHITGRAPFE